MMVHTNKYLYYNVYVKVQNCMIKNCSSVGVGFEGNDISIAKNNIIQNNHHEETPGVGIQVILGKGFTFVSNNIIENNIGPYGSGLYIYESNNVSLYNNTIQQNVASTYGAGIYIEQSNYTTIEGNIISYNEA